MNEVIVKMKQIRNVDKITDKKFVFQEVWAAKELKVLKVSD